MPGILYSNGKSEVSNIHISIVLITLKSVAAQKRTLIVPDKDADGLTSGVILRNTLLLLGLQKDLISVHLLRKGTSIHDDSERDIMSALDPSYVFVLDQGSRNAPPVVTNKDHEALIIDHHWALDTDFPAGSQHVTACDSPPVATTSLLVYTICSALHPDVTATESPNPWLCVVGTHGDLGNTLKWAPPFPDMTSTFKLHTKKTLNEVVSLINAPRRTAAFNVIAAWDALSSATNPKDVLTAPALLKARAEVNAEVERCTHAAPQFSSAGNIAVFRISSPFQVHPVIATRWAGHLQSPKLEVILVANDGYLPGMVNFSCRIPRCARSRDPPVNIIETLRDIAGQARDSTLRERLGESFARGHKEASGGIVPVKEFDELIEVLEIGRTTKKKTDSSPAKPKQSNTLANYFKKA